MRRFLLTTCAFVALGSLASAADMPVKAVPPAAVAISQGFYVWVDGSHQSVHLPRFALGWHNLSVAAPFSDRGPTENYDPIAKGWGVSGGVGYYLPHGTLPPFFGTNARFEVGAAYVKADVSQSGVSPTLVGTVSGLGFFLPLLNGTQAIGGFQCALPGCATASTLSTRFTEWRINGKLAGDHVFAGAVVTPSIAVFGGTSRTNQDFTQQEFSVGSPSTTLYAATVALRWTDIGAKLGLDVRRDITPWVALGLGGSIGLAHRDVSLAASDVATLGAFSLGASAINANGNVTPFLANAEARVFINPLRNVSIKGFVGLNYDNKVPGITAPSFASAFPAPGTAVTPSTIGFSHVTSYYAGGGLTIKFN